MNVFQEALGRFGKPVEEGVDRLVNVFVEPIRDRNVEKTVEEPMVDSPGVAVRHQGEGPGTSHPKLGCHAQVAIEGDGSYNSFTIGSRGWRWCAGEN